MQSQLTPFSSNPQIKVVTKYAFNCIAPYEFIIYIIRIYINKSLFLIQIDHCDLVILKVAHQPKKCGQPYCRRTNDLSRLSVIRTFIIEYKLLDIAWIRRISLILIRVNMNASVSTLFTFLIKWCKTKYWHTESFYYRANLLSRLGL